MNTRNIIHIYMKETGESLYYSSLSTFLKNTDYEKTNVVEQSVRNYWSANKTDRYENDKLIIKKEVLHLDQRKKRKNKKYTYTVIPTEKEKQGKKKEAKEENRGKRE